MLRPPSRSLEVMPVKPLSFKGDRKTKKRKHREHDTDPDSSAVVPAAGAVADNQGAELWTTPDAPSDLSGPIMLVLSTIPPTCLASDAHGNVFASQIENMVEQYAETAEPHDVRQVFVVTQVAGTEQVSFKASHGGYLSCDTLGVLSAKREARGSEEGFMVEEVDGEKPRWRIRTTASKLNEEEAGRRYLSAATELSSSKDEERKKVSISLRGDGEANEQTTEMIIKMQARFKPRLQQSKETKAREKVSRRELEQAVGRRLEDDEVKRLKRARKNGTYHEEILDVRVKGKHDKFA
jgi:protein FRG1